MESKTLSSEESWGGSGHFKIEINISSDRMPDTDIKPIRVAVRKAVDTVKSEVMAAIKTEDPKTEDEIMKNKKLLNIFEGSIFVEEIPNEYCSDWCCRHLPWFIVTTKKGRIKIGWRKRVIHIDWFETVGTSISDVLFFDEDVTKGVKYIHAWSIEKAHEYIKEILG